MEAAAVGHPNFESDMEALDRKDYKAGCMDCNQVGPHIAILAEVVAVHSLDTADTRGLGPAAVDKRKDCKRDKRLDMLDMDSRRSPGACLARGLAELPELGPSVWVEAGEVAEFVFVETMDAQEDLKQRWKRCFVGGPRMMPNNGKRKHLNITKAKFILLHICTRLEWGCTNQCYSTKLQLHEYELGLNGVATFF